VHILIRIPKKGFKYALVGEKKGGQGYLPDYNIQQYSGECKEFLRSFCGAEVLRCCDGTSTM
jgi:hypothetical protein